MATEPGHIQISEFSRDVIPSINWMMEDLFCRYGVSIPYFMLDFDFPDFSQRPDWCSGYNFNLDWGPWGYWLVWFNNLLGLLFDTANLPRWQMPDFSPASVDMFNSKISELYEQQEPEIFIHCYDYATSDYAIWSFSRNGAYLNKWTTPSWNIENNMCVDSSHNVYMTADEVNYKILKKWDKTGTLLVTLTTDWTEGIAIGPDGNLYTRQLGDVEFGGGHVIVKRDPDDLTTIDHMVINSTERAFTLDSDGYLYIEDTVGVDAVEKWGFGDDTRTASRSMPAQYGGPSLAYANGWIGLCGQGTNIHTIPTALDEAWTDWSFPANMTSARHIAAIDDHFLIGGHNTSDDQYKLGKYTSTGTEVWLKDIAHEDDITIIGVAAYPF